MKVQGHLRDYPLTDLFKILDSRHESGCLRIEFDLQPALLYFNSGQLVDARIADLEGFPAIQLACSKGTAPFVFDNAIVPPSSTIFNDNERVLLTQVFGLVPNDKPQPDRISREQQEAPCESDPARPILKKETSDVPGSSAQAPTPITPQFVTVGPLSVAVGRFFRGYSNLLTIPEQTFDYLPSKKLLRAAAAILVIAVPATVGLTLRLGKRGAATPVVVAASETTAPKDSSPTPVRNVEVKQSPATPVEAAVAASKKIPPPVERNTRAVTKVSPSDEPKIVEESTVAAEPTQPSAAVVEDSKPRASVEQESKPESVSKTIVVMVRVEEGRVAEAWVKDSHRGLEAFEASAIRLARQRRYSKDTSRTEAVAVNVTVNQ
jgi:hypothetical protein